MYFGGIGVVFHLGRVRFREWNLSEKFLRVFFLLLVFIVFFFGVWRAEVFVYGKGVVVFL